ncbi:conserved hypothetical protein [Candidatus Sulfopaludibacter sp. SbA4]|nr:conserved hypothetical protein [Candidatus Sulfopaludibacter sp. SbA4]
MPTRSRTTFKKRQKELARMEKQRDKAARRMQRKLDPKETGEPDPAPEATEELVAGMDAEPSAKSL